MLRSVPAIIPISNKDLTRTASGFGLRIHPIYKIIKFHSGMDFTAPAGTDVYATGNGVVACRISLPREDLVKILLLIMVSDIPAFMHISAISM